MRVASQSAIAARCVPHDTQRRCERDVGRVIKAIATINDEANAEQIEARRLQRPRERLFCALGRRSRSLAAAVAVDMAVLEKAIAVARQSIGAQLVTMPVYKRQTSKLCVFNLFTCVTAAEWKKTPTGSCFCALVHCIVHKSSIQTSSSIRSISSSAIRSLLKFRVRFKPPNTQTVVSKSPAGSKMRIRHARRLAVLDDRVAFAIYRIAVRRIGNCHRRIEA